MHRIKRQQIHLPNCYYYIGRNSLDLGNILWLRDKNENNNKPLPFHLILSPSLINIKPLSERETKGAGDEISPERPIQNI